MSKKRAGKSLDYKQTIGLNKYEGLFFLKKKKEM